MILFAQEVDKVLFTIDNQEIYVSEFLNVYNKNIDLVKDEKQKEIDNYLKLFINYKLKIKQARDLQLDTIQSYQSELKGYREQLIQPYLRDDTVLKEMVREAYSRSLSEIKASHILILLDKNATPQDTLKAFNKITEAKTKIANGENFKDIAISYSEDPSVEKNFGDLGYFSVFDMVYPFESAVYNTPINSVSEPFKTKFGYHIVKVTDIRKSKGEIEASHIMIKGNSEESIEKINSVYNQLNDGEDFSFLAKNLSEDRYTANLNGSLGRFGTGKMVQEFEKIVFSLKEIGDYSKPFRTNYGWHIIRLDNTFPIGSYEEVKEEFTAKVRNGDRSSFIDNSIAHQLKEKYDIKINQRVLKKLNKDKSSLEKNISKTLFSIQGKNYTKHEFTIFLGKRVYTKSLLEEFKEKSIIDYYKENIDIENEEFAILFQEYKDGLLLFELMQNRIWNKSKDSVALKNYYDTNLKSYISPKMIDGTIAVSSDKKTIEDIKNLFINSVPLIDIKKSIDSRVIIKTGLFNKGNTLIPEDYQLSQGISGIYEVNGKFVVIKSDEVKVGKQQEFEDVRGKVISDYQDYLENEWIKELHSTYKVDTNNSILESLKKENE